MLNFKKDLQYYKFCAYGFFKNLKFFEPFFILFLLEKGLSFLEIGVLYSIREIITNILEIPTGIIADSFGRRRSMIFSFVCYILSFLVFYISGEYSILIIAIVLFSFGNAFRTGTHKAMIFEYLRMNKWTDQKVHYYGHTRSFSQLGSAFSSLIAASIVFYSGNYELIFLFACIPYIIDLFLMTTYPKELDGEVRVLNLSEVKNAFIKVLKDFVHSVTNLKVFKAIFILSVFTGYYKSTKDYLQPIIQIFALSVPVFLAYSDQQRTAVLVGIIYFFIYLLTSVSSRNSGKVADRFKGLINPMTITLFLGGLFGVFSGLSFEYNLIGLSILFFVGIYIIENIRKPIGIAYVTEVLDKNILATALSAESQANTLFAALFAPLIGFLIDKVSIGGAITIVSGIIVLTALVLMLSGKSMKLSQAN